MAESIAFFVPGVPVPQERARKGKHGWYDPPRSKQWKAQVRLMAARYRPKEPLDGPLRVDMRFEMPMPRSWSKAQKERMAGAWCPVKPDLSNLAKGIEDALEGEWYANDSRICAGHSEKVYAESPERVGVAVAVSTLS